MTFLLLSFICFPSLLETGDYYSNKGDYKTAIVVYKKVLIEGVEDSKRAEFELGKVFYQDKQYEEAIAYLKRFDEASTVLGKIYFKRGEFDKAEEYFGISGEVSHQDNEAHYYLGLIALKQNNPQKAIEAFKKGHYFYAQGAVHYQEGEYEKAISCFMRCEQDMAVGGTFLSRYNLSGLENPSYNLGLCYYKLKKYKSALPYFRECEDNLFQSEVLYNLKRFKEAEKCYKNSLDGQYKREAIYGLGWTYYKLNKWNKAREFFQTFYTLYPEDEFRPISLYYTARAGFKLGKFDESIALFREVINTTPSSLLVDDAKYLIGKAYFLKGEYTETIKEMTEFIQKYPESKFYLYSIAMIGDAYYEQGKYKSAISYFSKVTSPSVSRTSVLKDEANFKIERCYYKMGVYDHPLKVLENFVKKYPDSHKSAELQIEIAEYYFKVKNLTRAISSYKKVIDDFSWSNQVDKALFGLAECWFTLGEYEKAIEEYKRVFGTSYAPRARLNIAGIYSLLGDHESAIKEYEILASQFSGSLFSKDAEYAIGRAYKKLQKPEEARIAFSRFIERYPGDKRIWAGYLEIAKTYEKEGELEDYLKTLEFIVNNGEGDTKEEAKMLLGSLYFDKEEYETAKEFYLSAKEEYNSQDLKGRASLFAAKCAEAIYDTVEAISLYNEVLSLCPDYKLTKEAEQGIKRMTKSPPAKEPVRRTGE